jgi:glucosylceramidase
VRARRFSADGGKWPAFAEVSMHGAGRTLGLAATLFAFAWRCVLAQEVEVFVSSRSGDRLAASKPARFESAATTPAPRFDVDDAVALQKIDGFGASFLEAGLVCLNALDPEEQERVLTALFDPERGAGFSLMKTVIGATDFMSAGPFYSYDDTPGDGELRDFSIGRDLGPNGLVTYIKRARKHGSFLLEAPMDYPPDWMLTSLEDREKQDVDRRYYPALARYYLRYLREYEKHGVAVDVLSLFNEPGIYTKISYEGIRDLLKDHVGPLFRREGVRTRLCFAEAEDRETAGSRFPTVLDDPEARRYVDVLMYHAYGPPSSPPIEELRRRYPDLPIWQSEVCHAHAAGTPASMRLPRLDFEDGDFWGNLIVSDLEDGASAWIYWNMILDERGGPWLVSPVHENPDPNEQQAVVHVDRGTKRVVYTGLYYYLAHFSRFVRPGAWRVETQGAAPGIRCAAFKTPDGRLVAELINSRGEPADVQLGWRGKVLRLALPALSITTGRWNATTAGAAVTPSGTPSSPATRTGR